MQLTKHGEFEYQFHFLSRRTAFVYEIEVH